MAPVIGIYQIATVLELALMVAVLVFLIRSRRRRQQQRGFPVLPVDQPPDAAEYEKRKG